MLDTFQEEAVAFIERTNGRAIYADDMGGRKTGTTATWLARSADAMHILIVCPKTVHVDHWVSEMAKYAPSIPAARGRGTPSSRANLIKAVKHCEGKAAYVTTYDAMKRDEAQLLNFDTVIFDEGHALKGRTTLVAKCSNRVTKRAARVLCVTGTPVLNHAEELWQYLHLLDPKAYPAFWNWVERYFIVTMKTYAKGRQPTRVIGSFIPGMEEKLRWALAGIMLQRDIAEMFPGEPWVEEPVHDVYEVQLSPAEQKLYDKLVKHSWGQMPSGKMVQGTNAAVVNTRLQQIASDWGTLDEVATAGTKVTYAADDLAEWVRDGVGCVTFVKFRATAHALVEELGKRGLGARPYTGDESDDEKAANLSNFVAGKVPVLVGTYGSLREGVDGAQYVTHKVAMLDREWTDGLNQQAIGRVKRSGQSRRVEVRHYYYPGTVDTAVLRACLRKVNVSETLRGRSLRSIVYGVKINDDEIEVLDD